LRSGAALSSIGVATAAMTPESLAADICYLRYSVVAGTGRAMTINDLATNIVRGKRCHVDQLVVFGPEMDDLHGPIEPDQ
jgi:hypothetical protein